jgi:hypothetical protein
MVQPDTSQENAVLNEIARRIDLLSKKDKQLRSREKEDNLKLQFQKKEIKKLILSFKQEAKELSNLINNIHHEVYSIGFKLKNKSTTKELNEFAQRLDKWNPEELVTKKELEGMFSTYANKA